MSVTEDKIVTLMSVIVISSKLIGSCISFIDVGSYFQDTFVKCFIYEYNISNGKKMILLSIFERKK